MKIMTLDPPKKKGLIASSKARAMRLESVCVCIYKGKNKKGSNLVQLNMKIIICRSNTTTHPWCNDHSTNINVCRSVGGKG